MYKTGVSTLNAEIPFERAITVSVRRNPSSERVKSMCIQKNIAICVERGDNGKVWTLVLFQAEPKAFRKEDSGHNRNLFFAWTSCSPFTLHYRNAWAFISACKLINLSWPPQSRSCQVAMAALKHVPNGIQAEVKWWNKLEPEVPPGLINIRKNTSI